MNSFAALVERLFEWGGSSGYQNSNPRGSRVSHDRRNSKRNRDVTVRKTSPTHWPELSPVVLAPTPEAEADLLSKGYISGADRANVHKNVSNVLRRRTPANMNSQVSDSAYYYTANNGRSIRLSLHNPVYFFDDSGVNLVPDGASSDIQMPGDAYVSPRAVADLAVELNKQLPAVRQEDINARLAAKIPQFKLQERKYADLPDFLAGWSIDSHLPDSHRVVFVNPTFSELQFCRRTPAGEARGLIDPDGDVFLWPADAGIHAQLAKFLKTSIDVAFTSRYDNKLKSPWLDCNPPRDTPSRYRNWREAEAVAKDNLNIIKMFGGKQVLVYSDFD